MRTPKVEFDIRGLFFGDVFCHLIQPLRKNEIGVIPVKIAIVVLLFVVEVFSQSYVFNAYDAPFADSRDGRVYNLFKTDSSIWFVDNLKFNPDSVHGMDTLSPQSYCENFFGS